MEHAEKIKLANDKTIQMVSAPYFLITKLEAFDGRGGDYLLSHDIEDIIAVLDGRPDLINEVKRANTELVKTLAGRFGQLLQDNRLVDAVSGHMPSDEISQAKIHSTLLNITIITQPRTVLEYRFCPGMQKLRYTESAIDKQP